MAPGDQGIAGLYVITDARWPRPVPLTEAVAAAIRGGARVVQYRDKSDDTERRHQEATALQRLCAQAGVPFIVNDDVALAAAVGADGVHIGQDDPDIAEARRQLGASALIGVSCYADLDRARRMAAAGANYLAFGSVYPSPTKPASGRAPLSIFNEARAFFAGPLVAIGGIQAGNVEAVIEAGADAVAVIDAVFSATDIAAAATAISHAINTG